MTLENAAWLLGGVVLGWIIMALALWAAIVWNERQDPEDHD